jgi:phosphoglycerate dehydrogenase-like enzyme
MTTTGPIVVVADANLAPLRAEFEAALPPDTETRWPDPREPAEVEAAVADADVLVTGSCPATVAAAGKRLRLVHAAGAGTDGIDVSALPAGVQVANTFHHEDSIAEYVVAAAIVLRRRFLQQDAALRRGVWDSPAYDPQIPWTESLAAATVGFVGYGHIGARTWAGFRAFGARGVAVTRRGDVDATAEGLDWTGTTDDLDPLLAAADVVVVSVPLTSDTRGLIGSRRLSGMRPSAILVNVGRGPVVDQEALYAALRDGAIAGAAVDVWYDYPAGGNTASHSAFPFHTLPNVFMTPHSSGLTRQTFTGRAADIAANIARLVAGQPLRHVVAVAG